MKDGLRKGGFFQINIGVNKPRDLSEFLRWSQKYIDYKGDDLADQALSEPTYEKSSQQHDKRQMKDPTQASDAKPRGGRFTEHTLLNTSRAKILVECANTEFRDIKQPNPLPRKEGSRSKKYCRYHRSNGHDTNKCYALRDDIEDQNWEKCKRSKSPCKGKAVVNEDAKAAESEETDSEDEKEA